MPIPSALQEIVDDFAAMPREEKIESLIAYAGSFPELPAWLREKSDRMEAVPECMTPVRLFADKQADGRLLFHFDIPPQSPTVRGLAHLLASGLNGCLPQEVLAVPPDFFAPMHLEQAITQQRLRGFSGLLAHMKHAALESMKPD